MSLAAELQQVLGGLDVEPTSVIGISRSAETSSPERYWIDAHSRIVMREIVRRVPDLPSHRTQIGLLPADVLPLDLRATADGLYLRAKSAPISNGGDELRVADLFCGCGAMSLGVAEACRALGLRFCPVGAFDSNEKAMSVYAANFPVRNAETTDLSAILEARLGAPESSTERRLRRQMGRVDFVIAGPPCQGHSNLNNSTRRSDPRNSLYFRVARFAELFRPRFILVENVVTVRHDKGRVVQRTRTALETLGYIVEDGVVDLAIIGVPQTRRRHLLVAHRARGRRRVGYPIPSMATILERYQCTPRHLGWAIEDLVKCDQESFMYRASAPKPHTQRRIEFLFENGLYDLPDSERPKCHREKVHTYKSVYGRLRWDALAPTITGGFDTMGRGRFVHPKERRTLTPREAARLQFIPDFFDFSPSASPRRELVEMIGNAVPSKLAYVFAVELLR